MYTLDSGGFLMASRGFLRQLFDHYPEGVIVLNGQGQIVSLNLAAERLLDVSDSEMQGKLLDETICIYQSPSSHQRLFYPIQTYLEQGIPIHKLNHAFVISKNGKKTAVAISLLPTISAESLGGAMLIFHEQRPEPSTEATLIEREQRFQALFQNLQDGILISQWIRDEQTSPIDYLILEANPSFEQLIGCQASQIIGKSSAQAFQLSQPLFLEAFNQLHQGSEVLQFETFFAPWQRHLRITAFPLDEDKFIAIFHDRTGTKRIEAALSKGVQFFQQFVQTAVDAIIVVDMGGKVQLWNAAAECIFGYTAEEALGKTVDDLIIPTEKQDWVDQEWQTFITSAPTGLDKATFEFECLTKSGNLVPIEVSLSLAQIDQDYLGIAVVRDITKRKQDENAIQRRDAILTAVSFAADRLLQSNDWEAVIQDILATLGKATEVDRVYLFRKDAVLESGEVIVSQLYEWTAEGVTPQIDNPDLQQQPLRATGFRRWAEKLAAGEAIHGFVSEFPLSEQDVLKSQDIISLVVVPFFVRDSWWGFIGFDDCQTYRAWSNPEIEALRAAANLIGTAIHRQEMSLQIHQSEKRYKNLVERLPVVVYIASATVQGALKAEYVSTNVVDLSGYTPAEIESDPYLWIHRIHPEDRSTAIQVYRQHLSKVEAWDQEYRLVRKNGEMIWVREQAIPTVDPQSGALMVQGVIQDISMNKRRQREQEAIQLVYQALQGDDNLDDLLNRLLQAVIHAIPNAEKGSILLSDEEGQLTIRALYGYHDERIRTIIFPLSSGYSAKSFRLRQPLIIPDARADLSIRFEGDIEEMASVQSAIVAPLMLHDQSIGVISIDNCTQTNAFNLDDLHFLSQIASTAALVVENIRLLDDTRRHLQELKLMTELNYALRSAKDHGEIIQIVLQNIHSGLQVNCAALRFYDPDSGTVIEESACGQWQKVDQVVQVVGEKLLLSITENKSSFLLDESENQTWQKICPCTSIAGVPLISKETVIGVLLIGRVSKISQQDLRLLESIGDVAANALHRASLYEKNEKQLRYLSSLYTIDRAISSRHDLKDILNIITHEARTQLGVDALAIHTFDPRSKRLSFAAGEGFRTGIIQTTNLVLGEGSIGKAALKKTPTYVSNLYRANDPLSKAEWCVKEGFVAHHIAPLVIENQLKGVLEVFHRADYDPTAEWRALFEAFADQAAIAIDNAQLLEDLQRTNIQLSIAYDATIEGWAKALEQRDRETMGHSNRVTEMTLHIAVEMGIPNEDLMHIWRGVRLHDIGKMAIPDSILLKNGPLTEAEWEIMRRHPIYAYELLSPIEYLHPALEIPYCHHEHWDGNGYPRGLKGEEIPLSARIFAVVDVWDALTSDRPYRPAWEPEKALEYIIEQRGKQFDPAVVDIFLRIIQQMKEKEQTDERT